MSNEQAKYRCLVTGGMGYLGRHVCAHLIDSGFLVETLGLRSGNTYCSDLSRSVPELKNGFDMIVHCAGKAHTFPRLKSEKLAFRDVNVTGTKNLLNALEKLPELPKSFVFMSSVSVYGIEEGVNVNEESSLQSKYPYGISKIEAEKIIGEWCSAHNVTCVVLRLPLLAGKNPPGNLNSMISSIEKGYYYNISDGVARKSIVMAEDVAGIIQRASKIGGTFNLTDGYHPSIKELSYLIADQLHRRKPKSFPKWMEEILDFATTHFSFLSPINAYKFTKIQSTLTFDDSKARKVLEWNPRKVLENFKLR